MSRTFTAILCLLALMTGLTGHALTPSREHSKWLELPVERLLDMAGKDFVYGG